jgi:hypothetical protein
MHLAVRFYGAKKVNLSMLKTGFRNTPPDYHNEPISQYKN